MLRNVQIKFMCTVFPDNCFRTDNKLRRKLCFITGGTFVRFWRQKRARGELSYGALCSKFDPNTLLFNSNFMLEGAGSVHSPLTTEMPIAKNRAAIASF